MKKIFYISGNNGLKTLDHIDLNSLDQSDFTTSTFPIVSEKRDNSIENILIGLFGCYIVLDNFETFSI